jgi:hypothetical protein
MAGSSVTIDGRVSEKFNSLRVKEIPVSPIQFLRGAPLKTGESSLYVEPEKTGLSPL